MNEKQASVAARIAELACLPMSELWMVWDRYFPRRPDYPNRTHVESRLQAAGGGLRWPCDRDQAAAGSHRRKALQDQAAGQAA